MTVIAAAVLVFGLYALHRIAAVAPEPLKVLPFDFGLRPDQHALSRYHVQLYLATLASARRSRSIPAAPYAGGQD